MNNAAQIDEFWDASYTSNVAHQYMERNRVLDVALSAPARRSRAEVTEFEFLGERIQWVHENGAGFPKELLLRLSELMLFSDLPENWNSYGGSALSKDVIRPVLQLLFFAQSRCQLPYLVPLSDGGVGVRWTGGDHELEIDLSASGIEGAAFDASGEIAAELPEGATPDDAIGLFEKFSGKL